MSGVQVGRYDGEGFPVPCNEETSVLYLTNVNQYWRLVPKVIVPKVIVSKLPVPKVPVLNY